MITVGIDQGRRSGWGIAVDRKLIATGVAIDHASRRAVLELARSRNAGTLRNVLVMFEDHSGIPLGRLTRDDKTTARKSGRFGAPERSTASILGQGAAHGRWLELLDMLEHPKALRESIKPHVWRNKLGLKGVGTDEYKRKACELASAAVGALIDDHDEAEGACLTIVASIDGRMMLEAKRAHARADAKARKQLASQGDLFGGAR